MALNLRAAWRALRAPGIEMLPVPAETRASATTGALFAALGGASRSLWSGRRYEDYAREGYSQNVIVYRCIEEIAKGIATVPLVVSKRKADGDVEPNMAHPLQKLLDRPNPMQSRYWLLYTLVGYLLLDGNSYLEGIGSERRKRLLELYVKRPDRMTVKTGPLGVTGYAWDIGGQDKVEWEADPVTGISPIRHVRMFNPLDDVYGMSPLAAAAMNVDEHNQGDTWLQAQMKYGQPGQLETEQTLTDDQVNRALEQWRIKREAMRRGGDVIVTDGGLTWKGLEINPKDMMILESKKLTGRFICMAYGVPPFVLGFDDPTYDNQAAARLGFWDTTIVPLLGWLLEDLNVWFQAHYGEDDLIVVPDFDQVPALEPRRTEAWKRVETANFLTINEKREAIGYEPVENGDDILVPAGLLPLGYEPPEPSSDDEDDEADDEEEGDDDAKALRPGAYKLLTDRTSGARRRELAIQSRMMDALERALDRRMARELERVARDVSAIYEATPVREVLDDPLRRHAGNLTEILTAHYRVVIEAFGRRLLDAFKAHHAVLETKDVDDVFMAEMAKFITTVGLKRAAQLSDTTKATIVEVLETAAEDGLGTDATARQIREAVGGSIGRLRAHTIARTETHSAAVYGGEAAVEATGLDGIRREWIAAEDGRTRPTHSAADRQVRGRDEAFDVGEAKLLYPGDPAGPAAEVVMCRCVLGYLNPDE